jgi:outer membrane protein TolC
VQVDAQCPPAIDPPAASSALLDDIEHRRLDLVALQRGYESQEQTLRAAVLAQFPRVSLGVTHASDTSNVHSIILGATIDLPLFDRNQGVIAAEKATRQKLYDEYADRLYTARADVVSTMRDIKSLRAELAAAEAALPAQERLVDVYQKAADAHNADLLSYYSARNELANKRINILKLKQQLVQNAIALELASGQYLPGLSTNTTQPAPEAKP